MRWLAGTAVALLYVLHQDFWFWNEARPLVFGFLPIGLFYHATFTLACSAVMWLLVTLVWPSHLEDVSSAEQGAGAPALRATSGRPEHTSRDASKESGAGRRGPRA